MTVLLKKVAYTATSLPASAGSKACRMVAALFWMRCAGRPNPGDSLLATAGPGCDVTEGVVARVDPECLAHDVGRGLGLELGQGPVLEALVEEGVSDLMSERLDALGAGVVGLDPDAVLAVRTVAVSGTAELMILDRKANAIRPPSRAGHSARRCHHHRYGRTPSGAPPHRSERRRRPART